MDSPSCQVNRDPDHGVRSNRSDHDVFCNGANQQEIFLRRPGIRRKPRLKNQFKHEIDFTLPDRHGNLRDGVLVSPEIESRVGIQ